MNHIEAKIENLQRQVLIASDRISKLENFTQPLAHPHIESQCCGLKEPDPKCDTKACDSPHQKELDVYERTIEGLRHELDRSQRNHKVVCQTLNEARKELSQIQGDLSECLVSQVKGEEELEHAKNAIADLKSNNRYQKGHTDGANMILQQVREMAKKLKP